MLKKTKIKELYHNKWVSLYDKDGYVYSHETRCDGEIVAVLGYLKEHPGFVLGRFESTPCHSGKIELVSLTGGIEGYSPIATARKEMYEEAGYDLSAHKFFQLGKVHPSKSADTVVHLFAVPIKHGKPYEVHRGLGDKEDNKNADFKNHYCKWVSWVDAMESTDPLLATMVFRLTIEMQYRKEMGVKA